MNAPDPLLLDPVEKAALEVASRGMAATYERQREAWLQACSCKLEPFTLATARVIEDALLSVVTECRDRLALGAPVLAVKPARTWRPGESHHA